MTHIARHAVDPSEVRALIESIEPELSYALSKLGTRNSFVESVFNDSLILGELHCALDPAAESDRTRQYFATALEAGFGLFVAADGPADPVNYRISDREFLLKRTGPRRYHHAGAWLTTLWLSVIFRDRTKIDHLASRDISVMRESDTEYDEFIYLWIDSLQKFFRRDAGLEEAFVATMNATDLSAISATTEEILLDLLYLPIEMFYYVLRRDAKEFNESLQRALRSHHRYWSAPTVRRTRTE